jgi:hypothetical protein
MLRQNQRGANELARPGAQRRQLLLQKRRLIQTGGQQPLLRRSAKAPGGTGENAERSEIKPQQGKRSNPPAARQPGMTPQAKLEKSRKERHEEKAAK